MSLRPARPPLRASLRAIAGLRRLAGWVHGLVCVVGILAFGRVAAAAEPVTADRVAVRFVAPETGGAARPGFFTQRELAFFARVEATSDGVPALGAEYPERYLRAATDRLVVRAMLASLMIQRGIEPTDLPKLTEDARAELEARLGGPAALAELMKREGLEGGELTTFLRDQVRASWYIDRAVMPILVVTDDSLREAYRTALHPFRAMKFDDARARLKRWLIVERQRAAEIEFLQGARSRVKITALQVEGGSPR